MQSVDIISDGHELNYKLPALMNILNGVCNGINNTLQEKSKTRCPIIQFILINRKTGLRKSTCFDRIINIVNGEGGKNSSENRREKPSLGLIIR